MSRTRTGTRSTRSLTITVLAALALLAPAARSSAESHTEKPAPTPAPAATTAPAEKPAVAAPAAPAADPAWSAKFEERFKGVLKPKTDYKAVLTMEKGGAIEIQLDPSVAPNHVANFVSLARKGFYDGTTFHRVIPNFMAQGGDPDGSGIGGPGYTIKAEFNPTKHQRGTVSMARKGDPDSAGSQFFICFGDTPNLDNKYTVFGKVTKGMEVVDKITPRDPNQAPKFEGDRIKSVAIQDAPKS